MSEKKVIYFDLFDTLVTADRGILEPYFTREADRMGDNGILRDAYSTMQLLAKTSPEMVEDHSIEELASYYDKRMAYLISNVRPEVLQMLQDLKNDGWQLCVISDAARVDIAGWDKSPLAQYFDATVFSCDVGYVKPDPRLFEIAKQVMGEPEQCIFIGDGGHEELMGARRAGMATLKAEYIKNRRDEEINRYADMRAITTKRVAEQARSIDFSEHQFNRNSPFIQTVRSLIENEAHATKEQTEAMTGLYDLYKLAANSIGKDVGLNVNEIKNFTKEILGQTSSTPIIDRVKQDVKLLYQLEPEKAERLVTNALLNAGINAHNGVDVLEDQKTAISFGFSANELMKPLADALGMKECNWEKELDKQQNQYQKIEDNVLDENVLEFE